MMVKHLRNACCGKLKRKPGLTLTSYKFRGLITFISDECEPELMCLFTADGFTGNVCECDEGELMWIDKRRYQSFRHGKVMRYSLS